MSLFFESDNLTLGYGNQLVIKNLEISLNFSKNYEITGKNGSGKTTLIMCISNNFIGNTFNSNIYRKDTIEKKSLVECEKQINQLKIFAKPLYLGGGINIDNIKEAIKTISPHGIDISTGLKQSNSVDEEKLKKILDNLGFDEIS